MINQPGYRAAPGQPGFTTHDQAPLTGRRSVAGGLHPPAVSGTDVVLTWPAVAQDVHGNPMTASHYQVWRSQSPYCVPGSPGCPTPLVANHPGSPFVDTAAAATDTPYFYQVRAVSAANVVSAPSNRVGKWGYPLLPGD